MSNLFEAATTIARAAGLAFATGQDTTPAPVDESARLRAAITALREARLELEVMRGMVGDSAMTPLELRVARVVSTALARVA